MIGVSLGTFPIRSSGRSDSDVRLGLIILRMRGRSTQAERDTHTLARRHHSGPAPVQVRRMLERPFGSVRWNVDAVDIGGDDVLPLD
jgi:hypothetical protein